MNYFPHAYSARLSTHTGTKSLIAKEFLFLWQPMRKSKNASKYPFWVWVITISFLAWQWWKIPAVSFYGEESCWNNLIYHYDDHFSCWRWQLVTRFLCRTIFILTYHCTSTWKILSCLLLPFCLHREIMLQYEIFLMGRKWNPYLENSVSTPVKAVRKWSVLLMQILLSTMLFSVKQNISSHWYY